MLMKSYSLPELVRASALPVDTIRYYQSLGLLDGPRRRGRTAVYNDSHLKRLRLIRSMSARGLPLKVVKTLVSSSKKDVVDPASYNDPALRQVPAHGLVWTRNHPCRPPCNAHDRPS